MTESTTKNKPEFCETGRQYGGVEQGAKFEALFVRAIPSRQGFGHFFACTIPVVKNSGQSRKQP